MSKVFLLQIQINLKKQKKKIISYEEMLEMASLGAKVMQPVSIQMQDLIELILKLGQVLQSLEL